MTLGFNWIDLAIVTVILLFTLEAFGKSLIAEILDLASFLLALILSFRFYNYPATLLETHFAIPHGMSLVLGFMAVWFLTELIFYLLARLVLVRIPIIRFPGEKFLSLVPAFLKGILFVSFFLVLLGTFPIQPTVKKAVQESKIGSNMLSRAYQLEGPVKQVFGGVTQDSLTFLTIKPKTNESVNLGFQTSDFKVSENTEFAMIDLVNKERNSRGFSTLTFDSKLRDVARGHSEDMFKRGYFAHYSPEGKSVADRAEEKGVSYLVIGENLAYAPSLELAHNGLMNSPGHKANILSADFHKVGIGIMDGGVYGLMVTQVFSN
jgi:uncharacterized protein YkwD